MGSVMLDITMSLDGFVTAPDDRPGRGLGVDGEVLHYWVFGGPWKYEDYERDGEGLKPDAVQLDPADRAVLDEGAHAGAIVVGRRMYDMTDGWGGRNPFGVPCLVVTHRVEDQPDPSAGFVFVDGVEAAIERARELAGGKPIGLGGGASVARQALRAGLVDEIQIHIAPVILGEGRTLFGVLGERVRLERTRVLDSPYATHLRYRVLR